MLFGGAEIVAYIGFTLASTAFTVLTFMPRTQEHRENEPLTVASYSERTLQSRPNPASYSWNDHIPLSPRVRRIRRYYQKQSIHSASTEMSSMTNSEFEGVIRPSNQNSNLCANEESARTELKTNPTMEAAPNSRYISFTRIRMNSSPSPSLEDWSGFVSSCSEVSLKDSHQTNGSGNSAPKVESPAPSEPVFKRKNLLVILEPSNEPKIPENKESQEPKHEPPQRSLSPVDDKHSAPEADNHQPTSGSDSHYIHHNQPLGIFSPQDHDSISIPFDQYFS